MDLGAVIHSYGGPLLFVWAWLQGEAAVIVGGSLAAQGFWPARGLVREHAGRVMLRMRFAYGIRLPLPILCGAVSIAPLRFVRYNAAAAFVWAGLFTWIGYAYGTAARLAIGRVVHYETWALAGAITMGLLFQALSPRAGRRLS